MKRALTYLVILLMTQFIADEIAVYLYLTIYLRPESYSNPTRLLHLISQRLWFDRIYLLWYVGVPLYLMLQHPTSCKPVFRLVKSLCSLQWASTGLRRLRAALPH